MLKAINQSLGQGEEDVDVGVHDPPRVTTITPILASQKQEQDHQQKLRCEACWSGRDLWPCKLCQKPAHIQCAGTPALASDGALDKVVCKHCHEREMIWEAGPSSDETNQGDADFDTSSDSS